MVKTMDKNTSNPEMSRGMLKSKCHDKDRKDEKLGVEKHQKD
jgi:hypothetical protein